MSIGDGDETSSALLNVRVELARAHLGDGRVLRANAEGNSMWPLLRDGVVVAIEPCVGADVAVGDVVLVARGPLLVLHRVIKADRLQLLLKGDACPRTDGWVAREAVMGRLARRPWDRWVARLAPWTGPSAVVARRITQGFFDRLRGRS